MTRKYSRLLTLAAWLVGAWTVLGFAVFGCAEDSYVTNFRSCLAGTGSSCTFGASGTHTVCTVLDINNSNLATIAGYDSNPSDTVLRRGDGSLASIMKWTSAAQGLYVEYLTFDGNRWGFGSAPTSSQYSTAPNISCLEQTDTYTDLDLNGATIATVWYVNFINAPEQSLVLGGSTYTTTSASTVSYSNFGSSSDSTKANRTTAMSVKGYYSGAYYNNVYYAGTAGINLNNGTHQTAYGNYLYMNRYEMSDGSAGAAFYVDFSASAASVASNTVDQNFWFTCTSGCNNKATTSTVNGCPAPASEPQFPGTMEVYGHDNYFYNNELRNSTNDAMGIGDGSTYNIYISGTNPFTSTDPAKYIHDIYWNSINFKAAGTSGVSGVTLDQVRVCNTGYSSAPSTPYYYGAPFGGIGVNFDYTSGTGFTNGATMSGNISANVAVGTGSSLTTSTPSPVTSCPSPIP